MRTNIEKYSGCWHGSQTESGQHPPYQGPPGTGLNFIFLRQVDQQWLGVPWDHFQGMRTDLAHTSDRKALTMWRKQTISWHANQDLKNADDTLQDNLVCATVIDFRKGSLDWNFFTTQFQVTSWAPILDIQKPCIIHTFRIPLKTKQKNFARTNRNPSTSPCTTSSWTPSKHSSPSNQTQ